MKIRPMSDRVLVEIEEKKESKGGVFLPDSVQANDLAYGIIRAVGPDVDMSTDKCGLKVGDKVAFVRYSAAAITDGDGEFLILRKDDVIATIDLNG